MYESLYNNADRARMRLAGRVGQLEAGIKSALRDLTRDPVDTEAAKRHLLSALAENTFEAVLMAFSADLGDPPDDREMDRIYNKAIDAGLVSVAELKLSFQTFVRQLLIKERNAS